MSNSNTEADKDSSPKKLKSGKSRIMSFVKFINKTMKKVDVVWINYEGQGVRYKTLESDASVVVNTYVGHPWVFRDSQSGEKMVVQLKYVFSPPAWDAGPGLPPSRKIFNITIPMYTLKERSMQVVRSVFNRKKIANLEIPKTLIDDLLCNSTEKQLDDVDSQMDAVG